MKKVILLIALFVMSIQPAIATGYDEANWFATVDVEQVRTKILPLLAKNKHANVKINLDEHLPDGLVKLTLYGHSEQEDDLGLVAVGDFTGFDLNEYVNGLMYWVEPEEEVTFNLIESEYHAGQMIQHFSFSDGENTKSIYSTQLSDELIVISVELDEVKQWANGAYNDFQMNQSGLVSLSVNIESAMAHMGADLSSNTGPFNSVVVSKIKQFSASIYDVGEGLSIEGALGTADAATAKQLEQVVNGLIAMNALSNLDQKNPIVAALVASLAIINQGNELIISTELPYNLIPVMDVD
ncbi:hypothetical protein OS175_10320 [Marinicella sp. S1101]|uniref:hypothetical protein n=1 Tax=Marinicella marina TaxID=2996016 RepID=UPI0022608F8A|nr:hypothetical protein [Marinicella marina]MCX7554274.1 hypothetical protein [Marinicella marina]MDJ1138735.1 hypothetical protein [Marinicella marina]